MLHAFGHRQFLLRGQFGRDGRRVATRRRDGLGVGDERIVHLQKIAPNQAIQPPRMSRRPPQASRSYGPGCTR